MPHEEIPQLAAFDEAALDLAFASLTRELEASAAALTTAEAVESFRLEWLGRKQGRLKLVGDAWLKAAPVEAKKLLGQRCFVKTIRRRARALEDESNAVIPTAIFRGVIARRMGCHLEDAAQFDFFEQQRQMILFEQGDEFVGVSPFCSVVILHHKGLFDCVHSWSVHRTLPGFIIHHRGHRVHRGRFRMRVRGTRHAVYDSSDHPVTGLPDCSNEGYLRVL